MSSDSPSKQYHGYATQGLIKLPPLFHLADTAMELEACEPPNFMTYMLTLCLVSQPLSKNRKSCLIGRPNLVLHACQEL